MKFDYQKEIDGLRAFAIIPVILFHLSINVIPYGYLGVDLFFVISGFVITKTIIREKEKSGDIKIVNFFKRRIKRILPALFLMIFTTLGMLFYFGVLNLSNFHLYLKTGLLALLGFSNIFLIYKNDDYFANQENNPFTHTWSLGVEEQFYLFYPFLLYLIYNFFLKIDISKKLILTIISIILISLFNFFYNNSFFGNFYSPLIRFWELAFGCLAFFLYQNNNNKVHPNFCIFYLIILFLIFFNNDLIIDNKHKTFLIALATFIFLLIDKRKQSNFLNIIYKNRLATYLGKISYSLYLWHLPIIYFSEIYLTDFSYYFFSLTLTILIAHLSYRFVETPFRNFKKIDIGLEKFIKIIPYVLSAIIISFYFINFVNLKIKINSSIDNLFVKLQTHNFIFKNFNLGNRVLPNYYLRNKDISKYCFFNQKIFDQESYSFNENCLEIKDEDILYVINGDCHAQHFLPMLNNSTEIKNILFVGDISISTLSEECLNLNKCNKNQNLRLNYHNKTISEINKLINKFNQVVIINKIFLTEKNNNMNLDNYEKVYENYINKFNKNIEFIFIEPTPVFDFGPETCVMTNKKCEQDLDYSIKHQKKIKNIYYRLASNYENISIFNANTFLCPKNRCKIYDKKNDFLFFKDNDNISVEASKELSKVFDFWLKKNFYE